MDPALLDKLQAVDTPTVCNAIEVAQGKRGFNDFTRGTLLCSDTRVKSLVGYARTAKIAALAPPTEPTDVIQTRRMAYYRYMAESSLPAIVVIEDLDYPNCIGAYWGEINTKIHKAFGLCGVLTNGVMRDLDDMPDGFPVLAASLGPSHGFVHVTEVDGPVRVMGLQVKPGDLIHADRHGAVVIPPELIDQLSAAIDKLLSIEGIILDATEQPDFNVDRLQSAWAAFEKARV